MRQLVFGHTDRPHQPVGKRAEHVAEGRCGGQLREIQRAVALDRRQVVQSLPNVSFRSPPQGDASAAFQMEIVQIARANPCPARLDGAFRYGSGCQRQTFVPQRAVVAGGVGGRALQRAEIHDRLVVACRPTPVELFVGKRGERFAALGGVDGQIEVEEP